MMSRCLHNKGMQFRIGCTQISDGLSSRIYLLLQPSILLLQVCLSITNTSLKVNGVARLSVQQSSLLHKTATQ